MAAALKWFGLGLKNNAIGNIDFDTDTFKVMICTSTYVPNQDTHEFRSSVTNEVAPSGTYVAGGLSLGSATVTYDAATNEVRITWADVSATSATITGRVLVIYKARGGAASADELVCYGVESADVISTAGTFTIDLPSPTLTIAAGV